MSIPLAGRILLDNTNGVSKGELTINVVDLGADPTGAAGSSGATTAAIRQAFGRTTSVFGPAASPNHVTVPPGRYRVAGLLKVAPNMTIDAYGATFVLDDMARVNIVTTDPTIDNGTITIRGLHVDGNDANQGDEAADGNAYDKSKGFNMANGERLNLIDVSVRHTRGHGVNHWGFNYLFVRGYQVMQRKNSISAAGARRRDGITGSSRHIDIEGVSGYTADDMIGIVAGATWGAMGAAGAIDIETVNIRGVSLQVCDSDANVKAWRGVSMYAMNGGTYGSVVVSGVTGESKSGHVMFKCYADAGDTGPKVNTGYVKSAIISDVSGLTQSFSEFETFLSVSQMTIDNLIISNVARRLRAVEQGSTVVPALPTILVRNGAHIGTMMLNGISCVHEDSGAGRDLDLILIRDAVTTVDRIVTDPGSLSITQPLATTPGALMLLRKTSANSTPTTVSGIGRHQVAIENAAVVNAGIAEGQGVDANQLTATGVYMNSTAAANWPVTTSSGAQLMIVGRDQYGTVEQIVFRDRGDLGRTSTRTRLANVWSAWQTSSNPDASTWRNGIAQSPSPISPETLANVIKYVTGYQASGVAGDGTDANQLLRSGVYATKTAASANWPFTSGSMQMTVTAFATGEVLQTVVRLASGNQSILSFRTYNGTTWTAWTSINAFDGATFKGSTSTLYSMISPLILSDIINQGGGGASRPTGVNRPLYMRYYDSALNKLIIWDGTNWRDAMGTIV